MIWSLTALASQPRSVGEPFLGQVTVDVVPPPSLDFVANGQSAIQVAPNEPFTLAWESTNASSCTDGNSLGSSIIAAIWQGNKPGFFSSPIYYWQYPPSRKRPG